MGIWLEGLSNSPAPLTLPEPSLPGLCDTLCTSCGGSCYHEHLTDPSRAERCETCNGLGVLTVCSVCGVVPASDTDACACPESRV